MEFDIVFDRVIGHEEGYVNNPRDPGGETKWGISKRSYPKLNIAKLSREDAKKIYKKDFWNVIKGDSLPDAIAFQLMDFAINSGPETAIRYFQRALGVADDGHFGPISREAMTKTTQTDMILRLNAERLDYMTRLSNWSNASRGWARRIARNLQFGSLDT